MNDVDSGIDNWAGYIWNCENSIGVDGVIVMSPMEQLNEISHLLPLEILSDIDKRVTDWLASGGEDDAPYIEQQLRFAKQYLRLAGHDIASK